MNYFIIFHIDTSRVSFEAADRPNYFLYASPSGQVRLAKWEEREEFWEGATFILHRNTWIPGYDSLESHAKPGFFLHATLLRLHLLKYRHTDSFRKATLFRLTGGQQRITWLRLHSQWDYQDRLKLGLGIWSSIRSTFQIWILPNLIRFNFHHLQVTRVIDN